MRIATTVPQDDLRKVKDAARAAEADGYALITTNENKHDPFLPLAIAAVETERLELATAIAISFSRSPMAVANASWDLNEASRGRFILGLGTQVKAHNERRFSVPWTPPAPRMREYVRGLKAIWRCWRHGEKLAFEGEHYRFTLMPPYFVPESLGLRLPPVTLAAVGPAMLRVAGEVADGVRLHPFCTRKYVDEMVMPEVQAGMARSGRSRTTFEITGGGFLATGANDEEVHRAREWVRGRVGTGLLSGTGRARAAGSRTEAQSDDSRGSLGQARGRGLRRCAGPLRSFRPTRPDQGCDRRTLRGILGWDFRA